MKMFWLVAALSFLVLAASASATTYNCTSCATCTSAGTSAVSGDLIQLTTNITYSSNSICFDFDNSGITIDCLNHQIAWTGASNQSSGAAIGTVNSFLENVTVQNCVIKTGGTKNWNDGIDYGQDNINLSVINSIFSNITDTAVQSNQAGTGFSGMYLLNDIFNSQIYDFTGSGIGNIIQGCTFNFKPQLSEGDYFTINDSVFNTDALIWASSNLLAYNNYFKDYSLIDFSGAFGSLNTSVTNLTSISGSPQLGGNYWAYPNGTGYSQTCTNLDNDSFCDSPFTISMTDELPLAIQPAVTTSWNSPNTSVISIVPPVISWNISVSNPSDCILTVNGTNYTMTYSNGYCVNTTSSLSNATEYCGFVTTSGTFNEPNVSTTQCTTVNIDTSTCNSCDDCSRKLAYIPSGTVKLINDIQNSTGYKLRLSSGNSACVYLNKNDTTFDCNGYKILGNNSITAGIWMDGFTSTTNTSAKNCFVTGYTYCVLASGYTGSYSLSDSIIGQDYLGRTCTNLAIYAQGNPSTAGNRTYENMTAYGSVYLDRQSYVSINNSSITSYPSSTDPPLLYDSDAGVPNYDTVTNTLLNTSLPYFVRGTGSIGSPSINFTNDYWFDFTGTGYSDTCSHAVPGFCDNPYTFNATDTNETMFDLAPLMIPDVTPPAITITSPINTLYGSLSVPLNVEADETIDTWWYVLNGGSNSYFTPNTSLSASEGDNELFVYANDTSGNIGFSSVNFSVDSSPPTLSITAPTNTTYNSSIIMVTLASDGLAKWYALDAGSNQTYTGTVFIANVSNAFHTLYAYANDSLGRESSALVGFTVNVSAPTPPTPPSPPPYSASTTRLFMQVLLLIVAVVIVAGLAGYSLSREMPLNEMIRIAVVMIVLIAFLSIAYMLV